MENLIKQRLVDEVPECYKLPSEVKLSIEENVVELSGRFLKKVEESELDDLSVSGDKDIDKYMKRIREIEESEEFRIDIQESIENEKLVNKVEKAISKNSFENIRKKAYKTQRVNKYLLDEDILVDLMYYWIDISDLNRAYEIMLTLVEKDENIDSLDDLSSINIDPFMEQDWTVNFYTTEPHKYWKKPNNVEEYVEMMNEKTERDIEESERFTVHHHNSHGLEDLAQDIIDDCLEDLEGESKKFRRIYLSKEEKYFKGSSYYTSELKL